VSEKPRGIVKKDRKEEGKKVYEKGNVVGEKADISSRHEEQGTAIKRT